MVQESIATLCLLFFKVSLIETSFVNIIERNSFSSVTFCLHSFPPVIYYRPKEKPTYKSPLLRKLKSSTDFVGVGNPGRR